MDDDTTKVFRVKCDVCDKTKPFLTTEDHIKKIVDISHKNRNSEDCNGKLSYNEVEIQYVMKTCWRGHWDNLENGRTYYTRKPIKIGIPIEKIPESIKSTEVIFLKRKDIDSTKAEKAWVGSAKNFHIEEDETSDGTKYLKLYFDVSIEGEISIPNEYNDFLPGKYGDEWIKTKSKIDKGQTDIFTSWGS